MSFHFRPARRLNTPLVIGLAGPTKSGKTYSAHRLAAGLAEGGSVAMINAEGAKGHQYADKFSYLATDITPPYRPERYTEVLKTALALEPTPAVVIIDSMSHLHDGPGGMLEYHEAELDRLAGTDLKARQRSTWSAWVKPKAAENEFIYAALESGAHLILCFRAKQKIKPVRGGEPIDLGWQPISSDRVTFETLFTLMLPPHSKGVPDLSLSEMREPFDAIVPSGQPLSEATGRLLAEWARGGASDGLSKAAFAAKLDEAGITQDRVRDVGGRLFAGKAAKDLTDEERAELWSALQASAVDAPTTATGGPESQPVETEGAGRETPPAPAAADQDEATPQAGVAQSDQTGGAAPAASSAPEPEPGAFRPPPGTGADEDPDVAAAKEAAAFVITVGTHKGSTIGAMGADDEGLKWIKWALRNYGSDPLKSHVWAWAKVFAPDLHDEVSAQKEGVPA